MEHVEEELPPGFRFHPTDEELITHYLSKKVLDATFDARAIGEVDLNKVEPWDLPWRAKMGVKEWYFFCMRDRKYPTGLRTNRATEAGYWKATGKDKEIYKGKALVGMKKTLVFYRGRAPKGEKCNWVMHEYRLEGKYSLCNLPKTAKNEWVISRVMNKSGGGGGGGMKAETGRLLPPLVDVNLAYDPLNHVTCFSNVVEDQKGADEQQQQQQQQSSLAVADYFSTSAPMFQQYCDNYSTSDVPNIPPPSFLLSRMSLPAPTSSQYPLGNMRYSSGGGGGGGGSMVQLLQSEEYGTTKQEKEMMVSNVSQETGLTMDLNPEISSAGCFWDY